MGELSNLLETIRSGLDAAAALLLRVENGNVTVTAQAALRPDAVAAYANDWHRLDPWMPVARSRMKPGDACSSATLVAPRLLRASMFHRGFLEPFGLRSTAMGCVAAEDGQMLFLVVHRHSDPGPFGERDLGMLRLAAQAVATHRMRDTGLAAADGALQLLGQAQLGVLVLQDDGRIGCSNAAGRRELENGGVFRLVNGVLRTRRDADGPALAGVLDSLRGRTQPGPDVHAQPLVTRGIRAGQRDEEFGRERSPVGGGAAVPRGMWPRDADSAGRWHADPAKERRDLVEASPRSAAQSQDRAGSRPTARPPNVKWQQGDRHGGGRDPGPSDRDEQWNERRDEELHEPGRERASGDEPRARRGASARTPDDPAPNRVAGTPSSAGRALDPHAFLRLGCAPGTLVQLRRLGARPTPVDLVAILIAPGAPPLPSPVLIRSALGLTPVLARTGAMLCEGLDTAEMARRARVSEHTLRAQVAALLGRLGVRTRVQAVSAILGTTLGFSLFDPTRPPPPRHSVGDHA